MPTGIIYLQKDRFDIFLLITAKIHEFRFVPEMIQDLDVISEELLASLIKVFVESNKIVVGELIVVLADNACFIKDIIAPKLPSPPPPVAGSTATATPVEPQKDNEELQDLAKKFVEHVPFDNVISKNIPLQNGIKVVAVNQDFYEALKRSFEKIGFKISAVLPGIVFGNGISAKPVFDIIAANVILQQSDAMREYNLLDQSVFVPVTKQDTESDKNIEVAEKPHKKSNKRVFVMLGVFAVLIVVLLIVVVTAPK